MQEKILRKTLRKVAAVGTSLAMMGITVSGAMAAGLGDYPGGLGFNKVAGQTVVVYGTDADMNAANDVLAGLPGGAVTSTTGEEGAAQVSGTLAYGVVSLGTLSADDLFEKGDEQDLDITDALNETDNFANTLTDSDLEFLKDNSVSLSLHDVSDDYDFHEEIRLGGDNKIDQKITLETGVTYQSSSGSVSRDEEWKDNFYLLMPERSIGYYYVFDEDLKDGNRVANSTTLEPFRIDFLGETISIENSVSTSTGAKTTNDPDTITLSVGKKAILNAGESISIMLAGQSYTVSLRGTTSTGNGKVDLEVTGPAGTERQVIEQDTSITFGAVGPRAVQVRVEDVFDEDGVVNDRATVIVGTEQSGGTKGAYEARRTYDHNNAYIGEDEDEPIWRWHLGAAATATTGSLTLARPILGLRLGMAIDTYDEVDNPLVKHPPYVGDFVCLPNYYACLVFDRMTESDDNFRWYEVTTTKKDLRSVNNQATADQTGLDVIRLRAVGTDDQGFQEGTYGSSFESDTLYVAQNGTMIGVWRQETDGSDLLPVVVNHTATSVMTGTQVGLRTLQTFARMEYGNTLLGLHLGYDTNSTSLGTLTAPEGVIVFDGATAGTVNTTTITLLNTYNGGTTGVHPFNDTTRPFYTGIMAEGAFALYIQNRSAGFTYLGHSDGDSSVTNDLVYIDGPSAVDISNFEENVRTGTGIIISDPDADNSADRLRFAIPQDVADYEALVRVARPKQGVLSTTGLGGTPVSTSGSVLMKDTEVGDVSQYNAVVVGGPCANKVSAQLLGVTFPACGASSGLGEGEATLVLKANGSKKALLVYGWEADDTRRAAVLVKDPTALKEKLSAAGKGSSDSVSVKGNTLDVAGITVA